MKWITRKNVKVDRAACPWLIRRLRKARETGSLVPAVLVFLYAGWVAPAIAFSQQRTAPSDPITLNQAVDLALANYPAIRAVSAQVEAAEAGIGLARTAYLPRTDTVLQVNRATHNNVYGVTALSGIIPSISGPVLPTSGNNVFGSAAGVLLSWEPFDFGFRRANVDVASTVRNQASSEAGVTELEVALRAADAFLLALANQETVRAARATVDRMQVFYDSVTTLVQNQLRPGADQSRAAAELAAARTQLIQAEQAEQISRATLAQRLGFAGTDVQIQEGPLLQPPPGPTPAVPPVQNHPIATFQNAVLEVIKARERALDRSYFPRFNFQSGVSSRGSGALITGGSLGGANGLLPNKPNWVLGFTATFPIFDLPSIRSRKQIEAGNERAAAARYDQAIQDLTGDLQRARAQENGARRIAENTPVQLQAARDTEQQAGARYKAGLATIVDVAEAQRLLLQAEVADAVARLGIWRSLLSEASAGGDIRVFLNQVTTTK